MAIFEQAVRDGAAPLTHAGSVQPPSATRHGTIAGYDRYGHPIIRQGWKTIEQISAEIAAQPPQARPVYTADMPLAVDIIRAERDAR